MGSRATCCCVVICSNTPSSVNSYSRTCTLCALSISIGPSGMPFAAGRKRPYTPTASVLPSTESPPNEVAGLLPRGVGEAPLGFGGISLSALSSLPRTAPTLKQLYYQI